MEIMIFHADSSWKKVMRREDLDTSDKMIVTFNSSWELNDFQSYKKLSVEDIPN